jgi:hypothetical protein
VRALPSHDRPGRLALENFDATGAWRTRTAAPRDAVDPPGSFSTAPRVNGVVRLREALLREPDTFVRTMTEKLMTYALGRGLTGRHARRARRSCGTPEGRLPVLVGCARDCPQRAVPDASEGPASDADAVRTASIQ